MASLQNSFTFASHVSVPQQDKCCFPGRQQKLSEGICPRSCKAVAEPNCLLCALSLSTASVCLPCHPSLSLWVPVVQFMRAKSQTLLTPCTTSGTNPVPTLPSVAGQKVAWAHRISPRHEYSLFQLNVYAKKVIWAKSQCLQWSCCKVRSQHEV